MKKKTIIIISLILIVAYFVYKIICLNIYKNDFGEDFDKLINGIKFTDTLKIDTIETSDIKYLNLNGFKIENKFKDFKESQSDNNYKHYVLYNDKNEVGAALLTGVDETFINLFKGEFEGFNTHKSLEKLLKKNNINNDIELFKYINKNKDSKNNIFTSVSKMKERNTLNMVVSVSLPSLESITLIEGDYTGYIFNSKTLREVSILKNDKRYILTFLNREYFTDENIEEILKTLVIE